MGVIIAYEMAQQLRTQGQEVALLALVDQGPRLPAAAPEDDAAYLQDVYGRHVPLSLERLRELSYDDQIRYLLEQARQANAVPPDVTVEQFRRFVDLLRTHTEAWRRYHAQPYAGRITLFRAQEQPADSTLPPDLGWSELAQGGLEVHELPGDHLSLMVEPHVAALASGLRDSLRRALGT